MRTIPAAMVLAMVGFAATFGLLPGGTAAAQPPDRLDQYRVVPRLSYLREVGNFGPPEREFPVEGEYGFAVEYGVISPWNLPLPEARFVDADLRSPLGPMLPAFQDVDDLFKLEEFTGELLPVAAPFDVWRFGGEATDGSEVDLYAAVLGPWMVIRGDVVPPTDFVEYSLRVVARRGRWADANADGIVNVADYTTIRDGSPTLAPMWPTLEDWHSQFGESAPDMAEIDALLAAAMSTSSAIPEPASVLLALSAVPLIRRRR